MRDYNFFQYYLQARQKSDLKRIVISGIAFLIIGVIGVTYIWCNFKIKNLKEEISQYEDIINSASYKDTYVKKGNLEKKIKILNEYNTAVANINEIIADSDIINSDIFKTIDDVLPQDVFFQSLSISNDNLSIQGTASNRVSVAEFQHNLEVTGSFYDINVSSISSANENGGYSFTLTCRLKEEQNND